MAPGSGPLGGSPLTFLTAQVSASISFPVGRNRVENALDSPSCTWGSGFRPNKGQMGTSV